MEFEKYREQLETMCKRCINHNDICLGTGCEPKKQLAKLIDEAEEVDGHIAYWDELVKELEAIHND